MRNIMFLRAWCRWYIVNIVWTASLGFIIFTVVVVCGFTFGQICALEVCDTWIALVKIYQMKRSDKLVSTCQCWGACSRNWRACFVMIFCPRFKIIVHFCFLARLHCGYFSLKKTGKLSSKIRINPKLQPLSMSIYPKGEFVWYQMEQQTSLCFLSIFWWEIVYSYSICASTGLHFLWQAEVFLIYPDVKGKTK